MNPTTLGRFLAYIVAVFTVALITLGSLFGLALVIDGLGEILARELSR